MKNKKRVIIIIAVIIIIILAGIFILKQKVEEEAEKQAEEAKKKELERLEAIEEEKIIAEKQRIEDEKAEEEAEENYTFIDAHAHLFDTDKIDKLVEAMEQNNVSKSVLFGSCNQYYLDSAYRLGYDKRYNPPVAEAYKRYPEKFYPCLSGFDPQDNRSIEYIESQLSAGNFKCLGELYLIHCGMSGYVKAHWCPGMGKIWDEYKTIANHSVMQAIWNLSGYYNAPVFFHYERWELEDVDALYDMFKKYPDTKFVWVHFGHNTGIASLKYELRKFPNVYYETEEQSRLSSDWVELFEKYPTRFLLGTDVGCESQIVTTQGHKYSEAIEMHNSVLSQLSKQTAENVAWKNMVRLFEG